MTVIATTETRPQIVVKRRWQQHHGINGDARSEGLLRFDACVESSGSGSHSHWLSELPLRCSHTGTWKGIPGENLWKDLGHERR